MRLACNHKKMGFTIAELLIASLIATLILVGAVAILRQTCATEQIISEGGQARQQAWALADRIADRLAATINLKDQSTVTLAKTQDGHRTLTLTCSDLNGGGAPTMGRYRLEWSIQPPINVSERIIPYSGTIPIQAWTISDSADDEAIWLNAPIDGVADRIDSLAVTARILTDSPDAWKEDWSGQVGNVIFRVVVIVGDQEVDRLVLPNVHGKAVE